MIATIVMIIMVKSDSLCTYKWALVTSFTSDLLIDALLESKLGTVVASLTFSI